MQKVFQSKFILASILASLNLANSLLVSPSFAVSPTGVTDHRLNQRFGAPPAEIINSSQTLKEAIGYLVSGNKAKAIAKLSNIRSQKPLTSSDHQLAALVLASQKAKTARSPEQKNAAIALYQEGFQHKLLGPYCRLKASQLAKSMDEEKKVQSLLAGGARQIKNSGSAQLSDSEKEIAGEVMYRLAESYYRSENFQNAVPVFADVRKLFSGSAYSTGAAYYLGEIALAHDNDIATAFKYFKEYLSKSAGGKHSVKIVKRIRQLAGYGLDQQGTPGSATTQQPPLAVLKLSAADHNLLAFACYKHTLWKLALQEWSKANYRHILRPVCLARVKQKQKAVNEFISLVKLDLKNPQIINVATELSKPLTRNEALSMWIKLAALEVQNKDIIYWNIAKRSKARANKYYSKLAFNHPKSKHSDDALWWLIWHHIKNSYHTKGKVKSGHLTKAAKLCVRGVQMYPNSELAPMYAFWSGKIHERLGQRGQAISIYKTTFDKYSNSYYGHRSKQRAAHLASLARKAKAPKSQRSKIKIVADRKWKVHPARKSPNPNWNWPHPPELFSWRQFAQHTGNLPTALAWLGQYSAALDLIPKTTPRYFKGWLMVKDGQVLRGLGLTAWKLKGKPDKAPFWQFCYPLAYAKSIDQEARKHGVDPLLAHGLIRQESRYDPNARSKSNAMGLMQLLKGTAYGVAKHNGIKLANTNQIFQPTTNIKLGCAYLGYVLRGKNGNAMLAVASYNGGPNAVKRWMRKRTVSDMDYFVENIPYRETRGYVRKVFANYWNYETIYLNK